MALAQVGIFPLLSVVFALLAFFIGYAIAVSKDHVDAWLPFISDCGCIQPESSIFGQLLNMSVFFLIITMFLVHRQTVEFYASEGRDLGSWRLYSFCVMILGWLSALGASMVANFQEGPQLATHDTGAFIFFIGITLYFWAQLLMAYSLKPSISPIHLTNVRLLLTFTITGLVIFHMVCLFAEPFVGKDASGKKFVKPNFPNNIERYNSSSPFYNNHIASTVSEWILALLIEFLILTLCYDFSWTLLHAPKMEPFELSEGDKTSLTDTRSRRITGSRTIDAYDYGSVSVLPLPLSQPSYLASATAAYSTYSRTPKDYNSLDRNGGLPRADRIFPERSYLDTSYLSTDAHRLPRPSLAYSNQNVQHY